MPKKSGVPIAHHRALNRLLVAGAVPPAALRLSPGEWIRTLRVAYRMTQAQLALRSGVGQSHIAMIEKERLDPQAGTLRRLFDALFCDFVVLPLPRRRPSDVVAERTLGAPLGRIWD